MRYLLTIVASSDAVDPLARDEQWFDDREKALHAARAIASPGSLSAEPGDTVTIEEVYEIFRANKPNVD